MRVTGSALKNWALAQIQDSIAVALLWLVGLLILVQEQGEVGGHNQGKDEGDCEDSALARFPRVLGKSVGLFPDPSEQRGREPQSAQHEG
jgi:hypothetical protein